MVRAVETAESLEVVHRRDAVPAREAGREVGANGVDEVGDVESAAAVELVVPAGPDDEVEGAITGEVVGVQRADDRIDVRHRVGSVSAPAARGEIDGDSARCVEIGRGVAVAEVADQAVVSSATVECVRSTAAVDDVVAALAREDVHVGVALERVVEVGAADVLDSAKRVASVSRCDSGLEIDLDRARCREVEVGVGVRAAVDAVVSVPCQQDVVAGSEADSVVAALGDDAVVPIERHDHVGSRRSDDLVVARRAHDRRCGAEARLRRDLGAAARATQCQAEYNRACETTPHAADPRTIAARVLVGYWASAFAGDAGT